MAALDVTDPDSWPPLMKTTEVALVLRTTRPTVVAMMKRDEIRGGIRVGRAWRIPASEVRRILAGGTSGKESRS